MERLKPEDPEFIGPWTLVGRLGSGGMARVYLGKKGTKLAAVKIIHSGLAADEQFINRFQREVEALQKLNSPHVANYVDANFDENQCWMATEYIEGPSLKEEIEINGPLSDTEWKTLAQNLLEALAELDKKGILHRDIKPSNIILSKNGPKLIDFGLAQQSDATSLTTTGLIAGSPAWMSPEIINGEPPSTASDLFSLGSVLIFAKSGKSVWGDGPTAVVFHNIIKNKPNFESLNPDQKIFVSALLSSNPQQRISKMKEFLSSNEGNIQSSLNRLSKKDEKVNLYKLRTKLLSPQIRQNKNPIKILVGAALFLLIFIQFNPFTSAYNLKSSTISNLLNDDLDELEAKLSPSCGVLANTLSQSIETFLEIENEIENDWQVASTFKYEPNKLVTANESKLNTYESEALKVIDNIENEVNRQIANEDSIKRSIIDSFASTCNFEDLEEKFDTRYREVKALINDVNFPSWDPPSGYFIDLTNQTFAYRWPEVSSYEGPGSQGWTVDLINYFGCPDGFLVTITTVDGEQWRGSNNAGRADESFRVYVPSGKVYESGEVEGILFECN